MLLASKNIKKHTRKDVVTTVRKSPIFQNEDLCIFSKESARIPACQALALRSRFRRLLKKQGRVWTYLLDYHYVTKKPDEVRLGKGKGSTKYKAVAVYPGKVLLGIRTPKISGMIKKVESSKLLSPFRIGLRLKYER